MICNWEDSSCKCANEATRYYIVGSYYLFPRCWEHTKDKSNTDTNVIEISEDEAKSFEVIND